MEQNAVDPRIAASIARRTGASSTESFAITRTDGTEVQKPRVGAGQVNASVPMSTWKEVDAPPKVIKVADQLDANPKEPNEAEAITIGNLVIRPNPIFGTWEGRFTRGTTSHEVLVDGVPVTGDSAIAAVYAALLAQQSSAPKGKK